MLISATEFTVRQGSSGHAHPFLAPLRRSRARRRARREDRIAELVQVFGRDWPEWADTGRLSGSLRRDTSLQRFP